MSGCSNRRSQDPFVIRMIMVLGEVEGRIAFRCFEQQGSKRCQQNRGILLHPIPEANRSQEADDNPDIISL